MLVELHANNDTDATRQLYDWLRREDRLRGHVEMTHADLPPGTMGGIADTVAVAVGTGGMGTILASSITAWLGQRAHNLKISITRSVDGFTLNVDAQQAKDPDALLRTLASLLSDEAPESDSSDTAS